MIITVPRYSNSEESTLGLFMIDKLFECYTLEDEYRENKLSGETRIPEGIYEVKFRQKLSPLTKRYRSKFPWFTWHLELQDVPGFQYIYIHIGNDDDDTEACILVADTANNNRLQDGFIGGSTAAFKRIYRKISKALLNSEKVFIHIKDSVL